MRSRAIGVVASLLILIIVFSTRKHFGADATTMSAYYYFAITAFSAMVVVVLGASIIYRLVNRDPEVGSEETEQEINRRDFYRIVYEPSERPALKIKQSEFHFEQEQEFEVLDISEQGIRFSNEDNTRFEETIQGELVFPSGRLVKIEGEVVRKKNNEMVLLLLSPIPYEFIVREQRRMITDKKRETGETEAPEKA